VSHSALPSSSAPRAGVTSQAGGHGRAPARSRPARSDRSGVGRSQPVNLNFARAMSGWRRYGKGRHQAGLNFGDCFTYALAERTGHPVLCAGDDFAATEITVVRHQPTSAEG